MYISVHAGMYISVYAFVRASCIIYLYQTIIFYEFNRERKALYETDFYSSRRAKL